MAEAKIFLVDTEFRDVAEKAVALSGLDIPIIDICDDEGPCADAKTTVSYDDLPSRGHAEFAYSLPEGKNGMRWHLNCITSGATGKPKGVVLLASRRRLHTDAVNNVVTWTMPHNPVYLWTLPLSRCNGWCFSVDNYDARRHPCLFAQPACW